MAVNGVNDRLDLCTASPWSRSRIGFIQQENVRQGLWPSTEGLFHLPPLHHRIVARAACFFPSKYRARLKGLARLREYWRQVQAEVVSNSRNKIHQTWQKPSSRALYIRNFFGFLEPFPLSANSFNNPYGARSSSSTVCPLFGLPPLPFSARADVYNEVRLLSLLQMRRVSEASNESLRYDKTKMSRSMCGQQNGDG